MLPPIAEFSAHDGALRLASLAQEPRSDEAKGQPPMPFHDEVPSDSC